MPLSDRDATELGEAAEVFAQVLGETIQKGPARHLLAAIAMHAYANKLGTAADMAVVAKAAYSLADAMLERAGEAEGVP